MRCILLTEVQAQRGRPGRGARQHRQPRRPLAIALARQDPANNLWQVSPGDLSLVAGATDGRRRRPARPIPTRRRSRLAAAPAHAAEPKNERVLSWLVMTRNLQAQLALARGDAASRARMLAASLALIEPAWQAGQNEALRLWLARTRLLQGEVAQREHNLAGAPAAWTEAQATAARPMQRDSVPFGRLDPLVRTLQSPRPARRSARRIGNASTAAGYVPLQPFPAATPVATQ